MQTPHRNARAKLRRCIRKVPVQDESGWTIICFHQFSFGLESMRSVFGHQNRSAIGPACSGAMQRAPLTGTERLAKRACDIVLAATALALLAPLMLMTALAIKLSSVGPVIIRQRRTGFDGRRFFIYKFRTTSTTDDDMQIVPTRRNVPRVTGVGSLFGQSGIDELPQLFNVLKGEMSLVGPRPPDTARDNHAKVSTFADQHHFKPGMTGWAEVNGLRGETQTIKVIEKRIELDLWYINNWSLVLDFKILWRACFEHTRCCA
jgi:lipopolysaccharide/colanic/teichoic acid biosynthesis glycosyltransferase